MNIAELTERADLVIKKVEIAIIGKRDTVQIALATLLSNGHLLIEDIPGVGKTTLARALSRAIGCEFKRIQFTPDMLPSDITGVSIFNQKTSEFEFRKGPLFTNVVLADEINRTTPKTQSALLECMEERQVTVEGATWKLKPPFFVIATQNNIELAGTYPLPEAQLDRFATRIHIGYPSRDDEMSVITSHRDAYMMENVEPAISAEEVVELQKRVREVHVEEDLRGYILDVVRASRVHPALMLGASPRGTLSLLHTSQALALIRGRKFVTPDDIKTMVEPALAHRLILRPERRIKGETAAGVLNEILQSVPVPLNEKF